MNNVGLPVALYDELPLGLSAGQRPARQRRARHGGRPRDTVMDETLSALDQTEQFRLLALFDKLQREHSLTYIFISHDLAMVRKACNRIAVMYLGEVVELADNERLFFDPGHPYTRALLSPCRRWRSGAIGRKIASWRASRRARSTCRPAAPSARAVRRPSTPAPPPAAPDDPGRGGPRLLPSRTEPADPCRPRGGRSGLMLVEDELPLRAGMTTISPSAGRYGPRQAGRKHRDGHHRTTPANSFSASYAGTGESASRNLPSGSASPPRPCGVTYATSRCRAMPGESMAGP